MSKVKITISDYNPSDGSSTEGALILLGSDDNVNWSWTETIGGTFGTGDSGGWVQVIQNGGQVSGFQLLQFQSAGVAFKALDLSAQVFPPRQNDRGMGTHSAMDAATFPGGTVTWSYVA
jgi:hypothetical protein